MQYGGRTMKSENVITRRKFLQYAAIGGMAVPIFSNLVMPNAVQGAVTREIFRFPRDLKNLTDAQRMHLPKVTMPPVVEDGSQAPIVVEMDHPMDPDHYIRSIQIVSFNDPVVNKGQFYFTPANGEVYLGTQIRLDGGESTVWVIAECNQDGLFAISRSVKVAAGGC
jgi:sulfur-oxidizing protein SoxY